MESTTVRSHWIGIAIGVLLLTASMMAPVAAAHSNDGADHPEFAVALESDGSATVTVVFTYDLESDAEQEAFRSLENDEEAKARATDQFVRGMAGVAADASNETGRTMRVKDATIDLRRAEDNSTGVVEYTIDWTGLARVEDDRLVVTEPFASGYTPDRTVTVQIPDGYRIAAVAPDPASSSDTQATWESGTDLEGFKLVAERTAEDGETGGTGTGATAPGFGVLAGMIGLLGALLLARRQRG